MTQLVKGQGTELNLNKEGCCIRVLSLNVTQSVQPYMTIVCLQVREMIRKSDQHRVPEVAHLLEGTVYDLPEHTVTVTDISEINLSNRFGSSTSNDVKVNQQAGFLVTHVSQSSVKLFQLSPMYKRRKEKRRRRVWLGVLNKS